AGQCSYTVNIGTANATDNCSPVSINGVRSDALALNAPYPVGATHISWTASDVAGNVSVACVQTITVIDSEPPVIVNPGTKSVAIGGSCLAILPDYTDSVITHDNCGV